MRFTTLFNNKLRPTSPTNESLLGGVTIDELKLTVVCPTYNHEKYIRRALDGFVSQKTNFRVEVLVGDDASTDQTPAIIQEYAKKYPELIKPVLRKKNLGAAHNFQDLIRSIDTEYVALCEGDDYWTDPDKLQKQVDFLDRNQDFAICYHPVVVKYEKFTIPDDTNPSKRRHSIFLPHPLSSPYARPVQTIMDVAIHSAIPTCSVVYRWRFRQGRDLELFPTDVNPRDILNNLLHAQTGKIFFMNELMACYFRPLNSMWDQKNFLCRHALEIVKFYEVVEIQFGRDVSDLMTDEKETTLANIIISLLKNGQLSTLSELYARHRKSYDFGMSFFDGEISDYVKGLRDKLKKKRRDLLYVCVALLLSLAAASFLWWR